MPITKDDALRVPYKDRTLLEERIARSGSGRDFMHRVRGRDGMRVRMHRIPWVTNRSLLTEPYYFQCPPLDSYQLQHSYSHGEYTTVGAGSFSRREARQLRTLSFSTLIVDWGSFVVYTEFSFAELTRELRQVCECGTPFWLTLAADLRYPDIKMMATLRQLTIEEKAGEPDARYWDLQFSEWRDPVVERRAPDVQRVHRLTLKDTLASLAYKYLHKASYASVIASANKITNWGYHTPLYKSKRFKVGDKIVIPAGPVASINRPAS